MIINIIQVIRWPIAFVGVSIVAMILFRNLIKMKLFVLILKWFLIALAATTTTYLTYCFITKPHTNGMPPDQIQNLILEIIFVLVVIVIGGEIYQYGMFMKEIDRVEKEHNKVEGEYNKVKKEYEELKNDYKLWRGHADALTTASIALATENPWVYTKALELLQKQRKNWPVDRSITFNLDYLLCKKKTISGYKESVELYDKFISEKMNREEYDADLGDAHFNRACSNAQIYGNCTIQSERDKLKEDICNDLNKSFLYAPYSKTDESKKDSELDPIRTETWFTDLWI